MLPSERSPRSGSEPRRLRAASLCTATGLIALAAAGAAPGAASSSTEQNALLVDPDTPALLANPKLRRRLAAGPHDYFRYVNARFREAMCDRLPEALRSPLVTLHGDPHLEQYAVTERGRGLADFDDTTLGPATLDLVRFATSLRLAADELGLAGAEDAMRHFLAGYAAALRNPSPLPPEPRLVARIRAGFDRDRKTAMARVEALMETLPPEAAPSDETLARTARLLAQVSGWPEPFFKVKRVGALRIGIGSAGDEKYLLRVEGETRAKRDDVILELKEVRATPAGRCVRSEPGPDRILLGNSRLAYEAFEYAGGITLEGRSFWFHAWPDNYVELDVRRDLLAPAELDEIARDVGFQLGRGHPRARGDSKRIRAELLEQLSAERVAELSLEMARAVTEAWQRYRERLQASLPERLLGSRPGTPADFVQTPFDEAAGRFSPDGRWVAYQSNDSGRFEIFVRSFPTPGPAVQVSREAGAHARWSAEAGRSSS